MGKTSKPRRRKYSVSKGSIVPSRSIRRRKPPRAPGAPGPHLRRDRARRPARPRRGPRRPGGVEAGKIDGNEEIDRPARPGAPRPRAGPAEGRQAPDHLGEAHDRQFGGSRDHLDARLARAGPPRAGDPQIRVARTQSGRQGRSVAVTAGLAAGQEDVPRPRVSTVTQAAGGNAAVLSGRCPGPSGG